jgi:DNA-binding NarL/FixJ family response regulator
MDVIEHLVLGKTNKEIADTLGLQVVTIKLYVRGICQKLGAQNRTQAALMLKDLL